MKYERITLKDESFCTNCDEIAYCRSDCKNQKFLERLVELENKIEVGSLIESVTADHNEDVAYNNGYVSGREYQTRVIFDEIFSKLMEAFPTQSFIDTPCKTEDRIWLMLKDVRSKCLEELT